MFRINWSALSSLLLNLLSLSTVLGQQTGPSVCDDGLTTGYTNITDLRLDILIRGGERSFTICPDAVLSVDEPIEIFHSVVIACGETRSLVDSCIIDGGEKQIVIRGDVTFVEFHGVTFQNSNVVSVEVLAVDSFVTFTDCIWRDHTNNIVVLVGKNMDSEAKPSLTLIEGNSATLKKGTKDGSNVAGTSTKKKEITPRETPIAPIPQEVVDVVDTPYSLNVIPMRKRAHHSTRSTLLSRSTSVTFQNCEFTNNDAAESIVTNNGSAMTISDSLFQSNIATTSIISIILGDLSLTGTRFVSNEGSPMHVFVSTEADITSNTGNCAIETFKCSGVLVDNFSGVNCSDVLSDCAGKCTDFDMCVDVNLPEPPSNGTNSSTNSPVSTAFSLPTTLQEIEKKKANKSVSTSSSQQVECPSNTSAVGYLTLASIQQDLQIGVTEFMLCPGSTITGSLDINLTNSTLFFHCIDSTCVWESEQFHIRLTGEGFGMSAFGITFTGATRNSIVLRYDNNSDPNFLMEDCIWKNNTGVSILVLDRRAVSKSAQRSFLGRKIGIGSSLPKLGSDIKRCLFQANEVKEVIYVRDLSLSIENCTFQSNIAKASMVSAFASSLRMKSTKVEGNAYDYRKGVIYLGQSSTLVQTNGVCGSLNVPVDDSVNSGSQCDGVLIGGGNCTPLAECEGGCLGSWDSLVKEAESGRERLVLCANSSLVVPLNKPLVLERNGSYLQCGNYGLRSDECALTGGTDQVVITGSEILISGITFLASSRSSIRAEAINGSVAVFKDCEFAGHSGATILINHRNGERLLSQSNIDISKIVKSGNQSMKIEMEDCLVTDNKLSVVPVLVVDGVLEVRNCVFQENTAGVGAIATLSHSNLKISETCFLGNTGMLSRKSISSIVYVDSSTTLVGSDTIFGIGNTANSDFCSEGILEGQNCIAFSSRFCESSRDNGANVFSRFSSCIDDLSVLVSQLASKSDNKTIEICPLAIFDMGESKTKLSIQQSNVTLTCGSDGSRLNKCRFVGGETQVAVTGNVSNVVFQGLTFEGFRGISTVVQGRSPLEVNFKDCVWTHAEGDAALSVTSVDPETDTPTTSPSAENVTDVFQDDDTVFNQRRLEKKRFMVSLSQCSFEHNDVTTSLLVSEGATLAVTSCSFTANTATESLLSTKTGNILVTSSCFDGNVYDEGTGLVTIGDGASFDSELNYAESIAGSNSLGCQGIFEIRNSECQSFNSSFCGAAMSVDCIDDWAKLSNDVATARTLGVSSVFSLCDDTVLEVDPFDPIELDVDGTIIQCGLDGVLQNRCSITGGDVQLLVRGDGIAIRGISMVNSSIAAIHAAGAEKNTLVVENCAFLDHSGLAVVIGYNGDLSNRTQSSRRTQRGLLPEGDPSMTIKVMGCIFDKNNVDFSPLTGFGGVLGVDFTTFTGNHGFSTALGVWYGGELRLESLGSCFDTNGTGPSVFIDDGSTIDGLDRIPTGTAESEKNCTGIVTGGKCIPINNQTCDSMVAVPPSTGCYDTWADLGRAVMSSFTQNRSSISFSICNDTVLDVDNDVEEEVTPIVVNGAAVEIKCGDGGSRDGKCIIKGGRSHFLINGTGTTSFLGITFEAASFASILAMGEAESLATFTECIWRQHDGQASIIINNQNGSHTNIYIADVVDLVASSRPGMTVLADRCSFENNNVGFATIANIGGHVNLLETIMANNGPSRFGIVAAIAGASLGLSYTCFTGNKATERGIVFVEKNSTLALNKNAFASDNTVTQSNCSKIFIETEGSCVNLDTCEGECQAYEARTCRVTSFTIDSTTSPTTSPTQYPSSIPPTSKDTEPDEELQSNGSGGGGIIAAAVIVPLLLLGLGLGYLIYSRRKTSMIRKVTTDNENPDNAIDGSHSRSKTHYEDSEFNDEVDLTQPLNCQDMPILETAAGEGSITDIENFDDEDPLDSINPENNALTPLNTSSEFSSRVTQVPSPNTFVRIPRNIGKKQVSEDVLSFRDLPTTF